MSVFAFEAQNGTLHVFANEDEAIGACAVENALAQDWLFFDKNGEPLRAQALPDGFGYYLRPWASCSACRLAQVTHLVRALDGGNDMTLEEVTQSLRS